ncbi:MAG: hypothetical protein ACXVJO_15200 [Thermoanaerobaculia bacterium]
MAIARTAEVQLTFTGICAFLRGDDGWPAAVMPNARNDKHHVHIPWMIINKKNWDGSVPFDMEQGDLGAWFLGNEEMWLDGSQQGPVTKYDDHDYGEDPTPGNAASIHWTTPAGKLLDSPVLNDAFRKPGDADALAQWFHLPEGVLRTTAVRDCVWELKGQASGSKPVLTQSLAQETALVTDVPVLDSITLSSVDMGTGEVRRRNLLLNGESSIRVLIGNTPKDDVFPTNPPETVDHHFMIYRHVFKNAPGPKEWPIPYKVKGRCPDTAQVRVSKAFAPERFNGHNCPPILVF